MIQRIIKILPEPLARQFPSFALNYGRDCLQVAKAEPDREEGLLEFQGAIKKEIEIERKDPLEEIQGATGRFNGAEKRGWEKPKPELVKQEAPVVKLVNNILERALASTASDIHLEPREKEMAVRYRVDGVLREVMVLPKEKGQACLSRIKVISRLDIAEHRLPQDGRFDFDYENRRVDVRVSILPTAWGEKAVLRILDKKKGLRDLDQLGMLPGIRDRVERMLRVGTGMFLVTGPTGSGKTTTLYSLLNALKGPEKNIITIEDPVEYTLSGINQVQVNGKIGFDFATGLRAILRQDPDVIMVGEIRDRETADIAVRAALTGHLVLSSLHTSSAAGAITRLMDMGIEPYLIASAVVGVMAQRLVRTICPHCKEYGELPPGSPEGMALGFGPEVSLRLARGRGCEKCNFTGFKGRTALHEVLFLDNNIRKLIYLKAPVDRLEHAAQKGGMQTLFADGVSKVLAGITTTSELLKHCLLEI